MSPHPRVIRPPMQARPKNIFGSVWNRTEGQDGVSSKWKQGFAGHIRAKQGNKANHELDFPIPGGCLALSARTTISKALTPSHFVYFVLWSMCALPNLSQSWAATSGWRGYYPGCTCCLNILSIISLCSLGRWIALNNIPCKVDSTACHHDDWMSWCTNMWWCLASLELAFCS